MTADKPTAVALVTGGAQGLGGGIAEELAWRNWLVIIGDMQLDKALDVAGSIGSSGGHAEAILLDIGDPESVEAGYQQVVNRNGSLDCVVHNAGVGQHVAPVAELSDSEWQRVVKRDIDWHVLLLPLRRTNHAETGFRCFVPRFDQRAEPSCRRCRV